MLLACESEIKKYCSNVTLGDGRLLACMYAHEDKVSDKCDAAIAEAADQLDWFLSRMREAIAQCAPDIKKHCTGVNLGEGRVFACLMLKKSELADGCGKFVDSVGQRLTKR